MGPGFRTIALAIAVLLPACSGESLEGAGADAKSPSPGANDGNNFGGNNGEGAGANNGANNGFVPEVEERFDFQAPRSSQNFIFVANSTLDTVSKINASTLEIVSIETGDRPTLIDTNRSENLACVLNEGSDELTIIRAGDGDDDYVRNVHVPAGMNQMALSPRADYALVWFDFDRAEDDEEFDFEDAAPPFQDVAVIDLTEGAERSINLTVGFQVLEVEFDDEGTTAFIITRTGVSVVVLADVDQDGAVPPLPVADVESGDETDREVEITSDGRFAFVRSAGLEGINVVDLSDGRVSLVALSDIPTDLDIVPGTHRALAVIRGTSELALLDLPGALEDPESITTIQLGEEPAGQAELTPDAKTALVFTSAVDRKAITVVDLEAGTFLTHPLRKGVRGAVISPDGDKAVVFHTKQDGDPVAGEPEDDFIAKSYAYSLFEIGSGYSKIETVDAEPGEFAFGEAGDRFYVILADKTRDVRQVEIVHLDSFRTQTVRLGSLPEHVGTIPNEGTPKVYISQEHRVGRMTFIDETSGQVRTVTGFELNSLIE
jgi:DNA-binding beta-propeller fold protein YncE